MSDAVAEPLNTETDSAQVSSDADASVSSAPQTTDANTQDSSTSEGAKTPSSLSDAMDAVALEEPQDGGEPGEAGTEGQQAEDSPTHDEEAAAGEAAANGAEAGKDGQAKANADADGSLNVSFDKRPEWQGILKAVPADKRGEVIKTMRPVFEQAARLQEQVKTLQPQAAVVNELRQYAGDEAGFQTMRNIVKSYATDPAASVPILEQMLTDARQRAGLEITSPDLKERLTEIDQQVNDGILDEAVAAKWKADLTSAEQSRAQSRQVQTRMQATETVKQRQAVEAAQRNLLESLNSWEENIRSRDPDFGNVTDISDPLHGKSVADQVFDGLCLLQTRNPKASTDDLLAEANRIHKLAKSRISAGNVRTQKVLTSHSSSITAKPKPVSVMDAMNSVKLT